MAISRRQPARPNLSDLKDLLATSSTAISPAMGGNVQASGPAANASSRSAIANPTKNVYPSPPIQARTASIQNTKYGVISTGAVVGVGIAIAIVLIAVACGIGFLCYRRQIRTQAAEGKNQPGFGNEESPGQVHMNEKGLGRSSGGRAASQYGMSGVSRPAELETNANRHELESGHVGTQRSGFEGDQILRLHCDDERSQMP